jgi:hypothetical protein
MPPPSREDGQAERTGLVGMHWIDSDPIPIPAFPLKGKEQGARP